MKKKYNFEEALKELKEYTDRIKSKNLTLDEAIECYEKGIKSYEKCSEILDKAKQQVSYYNEEDDE